MKYIYTPVRFATRLLHGDRKMVACYDCQEWYHAQYMYTNSTIYDALCNNSNVTRHCDNCCRPRSNFSTSLFKSFITDVSRISFTRMFADDCILYRQIKRDEDVRTLRLTKEKGLADGILPFARENLSDNHITFMDTY